MGFVWVSVRASSALTALLAISALSGSAQAQTPAISGTYWATEYHAKIQLVGGGDLPLTPDGKKAYEQNMAGLKDGSTTDTARKFCLARWPRPIRSRSFRRRPVRSRLSTSSTTRSASLPWTSPFLQ